MHSHVVRILIALASIFLTYQSSWAYVGRIADSYELAPFPLAYKSIAKTIASAKGINHMNMYKASVGAALEDTMHSLYSTGQGGYRNIPLLGNTGIDGLYVRGKGNTLKIIVAEGKFNESQLGQKPKIGAQMGKPWIKSNLQKGIDNIEKNIKALEAKDKLTAIEKKELISLKENHKFLSMNKNKIIQMIDSGEYNKELVRGKILNGRLQIEFHGVDENVAANKTKEGDLKKSSSHKKHGQLYDASKDGRGRTLKFSALDKPGIALDSNTYNSEYRKLYQQTKDIKSAEKKARGAGNIKQANKLKKEVNSLEKQRKLMSQTRNEFIRSYSKNYGNNIEKSLVKQGVTTVDAKKMGQKYTAEIKKLISKGSIKDVKDLQYISSPEIRNLNLQAEAKIHHLNVKTDTVMQRIHAKSAIRKAKYISFKNKLIADINKQGYSKAVGKRMHRSLRNRWINVRKTWTEMRKGGRYFNARSTAKGKKAGMKMVAKVAGKVVIKGVVLIAMVYDGFETVKFIRSNHSQLEAYQFYAQKAGGLAGAYLGAKAGVKLGGIGCAATGVLIEFSPICAGVGGAVGGLFGYFVGDGAGKYIGSKVYAWSYVMNKEQRLQYYDWLEKHYNERGAVNI